MAQTQNKNQKNPTHAKPVPATILPNNLDTETKTSDCTPKEIYVEITKMSSPTSQNITHTHQMFKVHLLFLWAMNNFNHHQVI
jgi:predicted nucleotide-binding protein